MSPKLSIPQRPSVLYLLVVLDVIALIVVYGVYSNSWIGNEGFAIQLPKIKQEPLQIKGESITLQVKGGERIFLGKDLVPDHRLVSRLTELKEEQGLEHVLLMVNAEIPVQLERKYIAIIQSAQLNCILVNQ